MGCNLDLLTSFKDNCGFGLVADMKNRPSHKNLEDAITSLERMMHRGAVAADGKTGDGSGLLLSMPDFFMRKIAKEKKKIKTIPIKIVIFSSGAIRISNWSLLM